MKKNIILTGMMGAGKTSVGKSISEILTDYSLIDTDDEIIKIENKSINEIFDKKGEEYFRKIETTVIKKIMCKNKIIVSTGGGILEKNENYTILKENGILFYLYADSDTLFERVKNNNERPLLNKTDIKITLDNLLKKRKDKYALADYTIDTRNKTPDVIAKEITEIYEAL